MAIAVKSRKPNVKIIGVESTAFPAMKESLAKGSLQCAKHGYSIADGIAVKQPGELTHQIVSKCLDDIVLIDDTSIVKTMFLMMEAPSWWSSLLGRRSAHLPSIKWQLHVGVGRTRS